MSGTGRNAPCPCGSGKKYKKCCLPGEEARRAATMVTEQREREDTMASLSRKLGGGGDGKLYPDEFESDDDWEEEKPDDFEEPEPREAWWEEFDDEFESTEDVVRLRDLAITALREAPSFSNEDGAELIARMESFVGKAGEAHAVLDVIQAWKEHRPDTYATEAAWLGLKRVQFALCFGVGDLEDAVMTACGGAGELVDGFESEVLEPLSWRGETRLLLKAVVAAWPSFLAAESGFIGGAVEDLAIRGVEAAMAAECEGLTVEPEAAKTFLAMTNRLVGEEGAAEFLRFQRYHRGLAEEPADPPSAGVADLVCAWPLATRIWQLGAKLKNDWNWPATRVEMCVGAWIELVGGTEQRFAGLRRAVPDDQDWFFLLPIAARVGKWWASRKARLVPEALGVAAWVISLPVWLDLHLADAPVPPGVARDLAFQVMDVADEVLDTAGLTDREQELMHEAVARCTAWAEERAQWQPSALPAYLEDQDIRSLMAADNRMPPDLWLRLVERWADASPLLHALMDDFHLVDIDDAPAPGVSRYFGAIHAAFIAAAVGDAESVPHIMRVAVQANDDEWLHEGLAWFPTAFGSDSIEAFCDFVSDGSVHWYQRAAAAKGIVWVAGQRPELRDRVVACLAETLLSETNVDSVTGLIRPAAATGDERALAAVRHAYEQDLVDEGFCGDLEYALSNSENWFLDSTPVHLTTEMYFARRIPKPTGRPSFSRPLAKPRKKKGKKGKGKRKKR